MSDPDHRNPDEQVRVYIDLDLCSAKRLARALRMGGEAYDICDQLATALGSQLGISSSTDETDELDESLQPGDSIDWNIVIGEENRCDNGEWQHAHVTALRQEQ